MAIRKKIAAIAVYSIFLTQNGLLSSLPIVQPLLEVTNIEEAHAASFAFNGNFSVEGASPKYGKTWLASIDCRNGNGPVESFGGGNPGAIVGLVNSANSNQGLGLNTAVEAFVRSDGASGGGFRWHSDGTIHMPTVTAVCAVLGYDTYVSSTCLDNERSGRYPSGKCNFHSPHNNRHTRYVGSVSTVTQCSDNIDNDGDGKIDDQDPGCENDDDDDESTDRTDAELTLTSPAEVTRGTEATHEFFVRNRGPVTSENNVVTIPIPSEYEYLDGRSDSSCNQVGSNVVCSLNEMAVNSSENLLIRFNVKPTTTCNSQFRIEGTLTLDNEETNPSNNTAFSFVTIRCGQCSDGIDNDGDGATDFPNDFSCSSPDDNDETNPKSACQDGRDNDGDGLRDFPNDPGCDSKQDNDEFNAPLNADLSIQKTGPATVREGENAIYSVTVTNNGPGDAADVEVRDQIPSGSTYDSAASSPECQKSGSTIRCRIASLGTTGGAAADQIILHRAEINGATFTAEYSKNFSTCAHIFTRSGPFDQRVNFLCPQGSNQIASRNQSVFGDTLVSGEEIKLCHGNNANICSNWITIDGATVGGSLNSGNRKTFQIAFSPRTGSSCPSQLRNTATVTSSTNDPVSGNNTSSTVTTSVTCVTQCSDGVDNDNDGAADFPDDFSCSSPTDDDESNPKSQCQDGVDNDNDGLTDLDDPSCDDKQDNDESPQDNVSDLSITLGRSPSTVFRTQQVTYTANVRNAGPSTANNVTVSFPVPQGLFYDDNASDPACIQNGNNVLCNNFTLTNNQRRDVDVVFTATNQIACGTNVSTSASVSTSSTDPNPNNNTSQTVSTRVNCAQCQDGIDNDNDGSIDFPNDFSCSSPTDNNERDPKAQCQDGADNDGDGLRDTNDPGCHTDGNASNPNSYDPNDNIEEDNIPACKNGVDDDNDGKIDLDDPGCSNPDDDDESDPPECSDGIDNDGDGATDHPNDFSCSSPTDDDETNPKSQCQDGIDNDRDGLADGNDPGCDNNQDNDEADPCEEIKTGSVTVHFDGVRGFTNQQHVPFSETCSQPSVVVQSYTDSLRCVNGVCPTNPGTSSVDVRAYTNSVGPNGFHVFASADDSVEAASVRVAYQYTCNRSTSAVCTPHSIFGTRSNVQFPENSPHSNFSRVQLPANCSNNSVTTQTYQESLRCSGGVCESNPGTSSIDLHAYPFNISNQSYDVFLSAEDAVRQSGNLTIASHAACGIANRNSKLFTGVELVRFPNGNSHSFAAHVTIPESCPNPSVVTHTYQESMSCGTANGPSTCVNTVGGTSTDLRSYVSNIRSRTNELKFDVFLSADDNVFHPNPPQLPIAWHVVCDTNVTQPTPQCDDGVDNDGDGATDWPDDFSCSSPTDNDETNPKAQCQDGRDNDGDGYMDIGDPGCHTDGNASNPNSYDPNDNTEQDNIPACRNGVDDDNDGKVDLDDPGCSTPNDDDETDLPECNDGIDNDGDGATDHPADFSCSSPTDDDETNPKAQCQDGRDNDGDGLRDFPNDPGCDDRQDNDEADAILPSPNLEIDKTGPATVTAGNQVTYHLTARNTGNGVATNVLVSDFFISNATGQPLVPAPFSFVSANIANCVLDATGSAVGCFIGNLQPGAQRQFSLTFQTPPNEFCGQVVMNQGDIHLNGGASTTASDWDKHMVTVECLPAPQPDLQIQKTGPATVNPLQLITYTLTATNTGNGAATDTVIVDFFPPELEFVSANNPNCTLITAGQNHVHCPVGTLNPGQNASVQLLYRVKANAACGSTFENQADVNAGGGVTGGWAKVQSTVQCLDPDFSISKTDNRTTVDRGDTLTYTITVRNESNFAANNVTVTDTLPQDVTFISAGGGGAAATTNANHLTPYDLHVHPSGNIFLNWGGRNEKWLLGDPSAGPNNNIWYFITPDGKIYQWDGSPATNLTGAHVETVDTSLYHDIAALEALSHTQIIVTWVLNFAANETKTLTVRARVKHDAGLVLTNTAEVDGKQATDTTNVNSSADIKLIKTNAGNVDTVLRGEKITYILAAWQMGPDPAVNYKVVDTIPPGFEFVPAESSPECSQTSATEVTCGPIASQPRSDPKFHVAFIANSDCDTVIRNTATASSDTHDPNPADNTSTSDPVTVLCPAEPNLTIEKTGPATVIAGNQVTYNFEVENTGNGVATNVLVVDFYITPAGQFILPPPFTFVSSSGANCALDAGSVRCQLGDMQPGARQQFSLTFQTPTNEFCGEVVMNNADVHVNGAGSPASDWDKHQLTVDCRSPNLEIEKVGPATVNPLELITYTLTTRNTGNGAASDAVIVDFFPPELEFVSANNPNCTLITAGQNHVHCPVGTLNPGQDASVQLLYRVKSSAACGSTFENQADVNAAGGVTGGWAKVQSTVECEPDMEIEKTGPATVIAGNQVVYDFEVTNIGNGVATNVHVVDFFIEPNGTPITPAPFNFVSASGATCSLFGDTVICQLGDFNAGESKQFSLTFQTSANEFCNETIMNNGDVHVNATTTGPASDWDKHQVTVDCQNPNLTINKVGPATVEPGELITYTLTAGNTGNGAASNVVIVDFFPPELEYVSATGATCTLVGGIDPNVTCPVGNLHPGDNASVTLTYRVKQTAACGITFENQADVQASGGVTGGWAKVQSTVECPVTQCSDNVDNDGDGLTDWPNDPGCDNVNDDDERNPNGPQCDNGIDDDGDGLTDFPQDVGCDSPTDDDELDNGLGINKSVQAETTAGDQVTYTVTVQNIKTNTAQNVSVFDFNIEAGGGRIPQQFTFLSAAGDIVGNCRPWSQDSRVIECPLGNIPAGQTRTFTMTFQTPQNQFCDDLVINQVDAWETDGQGGLISGIAWDKAMTTVRCEPRTDIGITKIGPQIITKGLTAYYNVYTFNFGPDTAQDVVVTDVIPAGLSFNDSQSTPECSQHGNEVRCTTSQLADGDTGLFRIAFDVEQHAVCGRTIENIASVSSSTLDPDTTNNQSDAVASLVDCPLAQCEDGIDNDGDGAVDWPNDFSCSSPQDDDESDPLAQCQDGIDNDNDGLTDLDDPGCSSPQDDDESDGTSECQDGIDNDNDGAVDHPDDFSCDSPQDNDETHPKSQCQDGIDNDGDGLADLADPGCTDNQDNNEGDGTTECQDGIDNDGDGAVDHPNDFSCSSPQDDDESNPLAQCQDGIDNDGDGNVDLDDRGCDDAQDNDEFNEILSDLFIQKFGPSTVTKGSTVIYTLHITNLGPDTATNVTAGDDVPAGLTFNPSLSSNNCELVGATVRCDNLTLLHGESHTFTIGFDVDSSAVCGGTIDNVASVSSSSTDPNPANNQSQTITSTVNCLPAQCEDGIDNDGDGATDWPDDFSCSSPDDNDESNLLAACQDGIDNDNDGKVDYPQDPGCDSAQDNDEFNVLAQCSDGIDNDNDGAVDFPHDFSCQSPDDNDESNPLAQCQDGIDNDNDGLTDFPQDTGCDSAQDNDEFNQIQHDLFITKSGPVSVVRGNTVIYTLTATNLGPHTATNVHILDEIPTGLTYDPANSSANCVINNNNVICNNFTLQNGESRTVNIAFTVGNTVACGSSIRNVGIVNTSATDLNPADNRMEIFTDVECPTATLTISKTDNRATAAPGDVLTYLITVSNTSAVDATGVDVSDNLPAEVEYVSATFGPTVSTSGNDATTVLWSGLHIPAFQSTTVSLTVRVKNTAQNGAVMLNNVQINGGASANDSTTVQQIQPQTGCIEITKIATSFDGTRTITPVPAFTFWLDHVQSAVNDTNGRARFDNVLAGQHTVTEDPLNGWRLESVVPANGVVNVVPGAQCAQVTFTNREDFGTQQPTYSITKTDNVGTIQPGQTLTYTIVVTNTSSVPSTFVRVVDVLPAELQFISATNGGVLQGLDVVWDALTLNPSQSITLQLTAQVRQNVAPGTVIFNLVQVIGTYNGGNQYATQGAGFGQATALDTTTVTTTGQQQQSSSSSSSSSSYSSYSSTSSYSSSYSSYSSTSNGNNEFEDDVVTNNNFEAAINPFSDTDMATLEGQAAADLYNRGILGGFADGEFKGGRITNRAEKTKFILLAKDGSVADIANNGRFPDVKDGEWYVKYVITAAIRGIVEGYQDGFFRPANPTTTAEFLAALSRAFNLQQNQAHSYADVAAGSWQAQYAGIAQQYNLFPDRAQFLRPDEALTRKDIVIAIYQYLKNR